MDGTFCEEGVMSVENNPGLWVRLLACILRPAVHLILQQARPPRDDVFVSLEQKKFSPDGHFYPLMGDSRALQNTAFDDGAAKPGDVHLRKKARWQPKKPTERGVL